MVILAILGSLLFVVILNVAVPGRRIGPRPASRLKNAGHPTSGMWKDYIETDLELAHDRIAALEKQVDFLGRNQK